MTIVPVTLEGRHVRLEPLGERHAADLCAAIATDASIGRWLRSGLPSSREEMIRWIERANGVDPEGPSVAFAQVERASGRAVGSTSYLHLRVSDRGVEIGRTWIGKPWQRTAINTEAKLLLLEHAFEAGGALRVELVTDERNEQSRRAIERLGAVQEGILRRHRVVQGGFARNTVVYSIVDAEWPKVKERLLGRLALP